MLEGTIILGPLISKLRISGLQQLRDNTVLTHKLNSHRKGPNSERKEYFNQNKKYFSRPYMCDMSIRQCTALFYVNLTHNSHLGRGASN